MRALSHPVRLALYELLAVHGAMTATAAAARVGESPSSCSFHLRQLAKYGFVTDAGDGVGRSRPWKLVHQGFTLSAEDFGSEAAVAVDALWELALRRQVDRHLRWARLRRGATAGWREVGMSTETICWVTPEEAADIERVLTETISRFRHRLTDPGARPDGARPVEVVALMHLFDPTPEH